MTKYLDFKEAKCRDCYRCLRECPVKAISIINHQARVIEERCILCGRCTIVCPQNAKQVHSELPEIKKILAENKEVIASVAPSFISSFGLSNFSIFRIALGKLGFSDAEETAVGANAVTKEYVKLMKTGKYENFITSACPAIVRLIQEYHPSALKYLAPVDSPMLAHAKLLKKDYPNAKIIFIGPCIAKKREAAESGLVDGVLTYEDMQELFTENNINLDEITSMDMPRKAKYANKSKGYPISHGIINSFEVLPKGYDYMAVDGAERCIDVLESIDNLSGVFIEMNICQDGCVNGPCSLVNSKAMKKNNDRGGSIEATMEVHRYVKNEIKSLPPEKLGAIKCNVDFARAYPRIKTNSVPGTESQITAILHKTNKFKPEDELNCGACGYNTCREKAWAVLNGYADVNVCFPYMRERAESMSYEIIHNSPQGLIVLDEDLNVIDINHRAKELLGIEVANMKNLPAVDFFNISEFLQANTLKKALKKEKLFIQKTKKYVNLSINLLQGDKVLFGIMNDVTDDVNYDDQLLTMKKETLDTTDRVIKKQMRVAQEIASLLGETTAETKVALLKLKKTIQAEEGENKE
ncbi:MAG: [Fe-Fe] hydrogenase large subunit C-terminal domain-containing protein [Bacteroidales bacterium]